MRIGGGAPTAFVITDSPAQKEGRARAEKEREVKRRTHGDEEPKKAGAAVKGKGRFDPNALPEEEYEFTGEEEVAPGAVPNVRTVYTPVPNRKRAGGARKKDHRKDASLSANPTKASKKIVRIDESVTVNDLAGMLSVKATAIIKSLMGLGMMAGVNQILDFETATIVIQEFGFEAHNATVSLADIFDTKKHGSKAVHAGDAITRPPVVTIMGHVDHGKTSLLDVIRSANVAGGEKGGITQHIGAYQVEYNGRKLTFLDTPGHEAFTAMRSRGAQVTDVVILVVAADDGVMPQTVEAIAHAKAAGVPIIVAINKIDKQGVNLDRLYRELADQAVISEEWGGDCMFVKVSAKTKEGIPDLLESIVLQADVLDLKTPAEGLSSGIVIEAKLDKSRGPVATVIVTQGILKVSDWLVAGQTYGRIRAMFDDKGERLNEAGPSTPVEILGLSEVPAAGDQFNCVVNDSVAKEAVSYRIEKQRQKDLASQPKATLEDLLARMSAENVKTIELPLIIKADTQGSVEAIRSSVKKLDTEKVKVKILHGAVGGITETDVTLGMASGALVVGFNVRPDRVAAQIAEREGVPLQCFGIIYELIDSVQNAMVGKLAPVKMEKFLGRAEVRSLFSVPKIGVIAGTAVLDGKITRNSHMRVIRDNVVIYTGRVSSLKRFKDDAKEVVQGFECGIGVENYNDLKIGDVLEAFVIEEVAATLH
jgi:translation initiation factor IF-2